MVKVALIHNYGYPQEIDGETDEWDSQDDGVLDWGILASVLTDIGFSVLEKYIFYIIYKTTHISVTVNTYCYYS